MDGSKWAGPAVKTKGDAAATAGKMQGGGDAAAAAAGQTKRMVKSTPARFPALPSCVVELQNRVKTLEKNLQDLAAHVVRQEKDDSMSMSSYADSCDTVDKQETCIDCKGRKEEVTYLRDKLVKKDKKIEKLKRLLDDQTK